IYPQLTSFFETPIDYDAIRGRCSKFEFIHCLRDTQVPVEEVHRLQSRLGGNVTITEHGNHFRHQDGVRELPEALAAVMRMKEIKMAVINR
ncbi:MAG: hypothetical protein KGH52_04360, partial [Candidatus Micrarchaeota archaeon]|nr:hypothetical protein [Candidatus Micrarchaeota archaeon]